MAIDAIFVRRGEALFGGDVGIAEDAVAAGAAAAGPEVVVGEAYGEVGCAVGRSIGPAEWKRREWKRFPLR